MTSSGGSGSVDHQFVVSGGNWTMTPTLRARESGEEPGEQRDWTNRSPEARRGSWMRRQAAVHGGGARSREGKRGRSRPFGRGAHQEPRGGVGDGGERRGRRNRPGRRRPRLKTARTHASATGLPGPIPCVGRERSSRRSSWRRRLGSGQPESTATMATEASGDGGQSWS